MGVKSKKKKKADQISVISARDPTCSDYVDHPRVPGAVEKVTRVIDSIEFMRRKFPLEYAVALRLRRAYDAIHGSIGGVGDYDRARGASHYFQSLPPFLRAADLLLDFDQAVSGPTKRLIEIVVFNGCTVEAASRILCPDTPSKRFREALSKHLRQVLRQLAEDWGWELPQDRVVPIRAFNALTELQTVTDLAIRGRVVHATSYKVHDI